MVCHAPLARHKYLVDALERVVNALLASWLSTPQTAEVFAIITDCEQRLQGYYLAEGFDIIRTKGGTQAVLGGVL
jgi:glutamate/tyrosine decarboxylase-like PLP-dependent enzyme